MGVPTLVIGAGMGGIRIVQEMAEFVREKGEEEDYRFIAIDSSKKDLTEQIKAGYNIRKVELTEEGFDVEEMIERCPYLHDRAKPKGLGALRERVYGRFLLDLNMSKVYDNIKSAMEELQGMWEKRTDVKKKVAVIWFIHTLGGGTGSGIFPALVVNIREWAKNILEDREIKPLIFCVGILPSATNIRNITFAGFNKRYIANSYAALRELELLSNPKNLKILSFSPHEIREIEIKERPFDRYFLFGIDEDRVGKLENVEAVEEYLTSSNKVIINMMYALTKYPGGIEDLWLDVKSPFVVFGESELIIPIKEAEEIAKANDKLGKIVDEDVKKKLKEELRIVLADIEQINERYLEEKCKDILKGYGLRGLSYFIGKLQNEFNKKTIEAQANFEDVVEELWEDLKNCEWAKEEIKGEEPDIMGKYDKILELYEKRKRENNKIIDSPFPRPILKRRLKEENNNIDRNKEKIEKAKENSEKLIRLKQYIDTKLCNTLREEIGHEEDGVASVVEYVRRFEMEVKKKCENLKKQGQGRVIRIPIREEKCRELTLKGDGIDVKDISVLEFIERIGIREEEMERIMENRVQQAGDKTLRVAIKGGTEEVREEMFILCHNRNAPLIQKHEKAFGGIKIERITTETFDSERCIFIQFTLGLSLNDIKEYEYRREEYERGELSKTTDLDRIGEIFACPEWFLEDENVREAFSQRFPKMQSLFRTEEG